MEYVADDPKKSLAKRVRNLVNIGLSCPDFWGGLYHAYEHLSKKLSDPPQGIEWSEMIKWPTNYSVADLKTALKALNQASSGTKPGNSLVFYI